MGEVPLEEIGEGRHRVVPEVDAVGVDQGVGRERERGGERARLDAVGNLRHLLGRYHGRDVAVHLPADKLGEAEPHLAEGVFGGLAVGGGFRLVVDGEDEHGVEQRLVVLLDVGEQLAERVEVGVAFHRLAFLADVLRLQLEDGVVDSLHRFRLFDGFHPHRYLGPVEREEPFGPGVRNLQRVSRDGEVRHGQAVLARGC